MLHARTYCLQPFQLLDVSGKLSFFTTSLTTLMESLCSCTATGYLGNIAMICDKTTTNEVIIQGQIVGTPTVSSDRMVEQLQEFILNQPQPIAYQGQALTYVERCSVAINTLGDSTCSSGSEPLPRGTTEQDTFVVDEATQLPFAIIAGAAVGGALLIIIVIVVFVIAVAIFRKIRRGKGYNVKTRDAVEM